MGNQSSQAYMNESDLLKHGFVGIWTVELPIFFILVPVVWGLPLLWQSYLHEYCRVSILF